MATVGFTLANPGSGGAGTDIPRLIEKPILSGYAENEGALLTIDVNGNYVACGADPAQVAACALTQGGAYSANPGFNILGRYEFPPLTMQGIWTGNNTVFNAPFLGAVPAFTGNDVYGVTRDADLTWKVDFGKPDKPTVQFLANPLRSPADAAGAGQSTLVQVMFLPGSVQAI